MSHHGKFSKYTVHEFAVDLFPHCLPTSAAGLRTGRFSRQPYFFHGQQGGGVGGALSEDFPGAGSSLYRHRGQF